MAESIRKTFRAMGTVNTITVYRRQDENAVREAARRVSDLDDRLSVFKRDSEISEVNALAGKRFVSVHPDTLSLLKTAKEFSVLSEGAFSVTTCPLTKLWGIGTSQSIVPHATDRETARSLIDDNDLILDESHNRVMLKRQGQAVDLGGIAKGFAADEVRRILFDCGVRDAIINLGGTVIVMGEPKTIGIQHPKKIRGVSVGRLQIQNSAVVTSGSYERATETDGVRYHHILNPETGMPSDAGLCSVTLIGSSATELDALATAVFVLGAEKGARLAARRNADVIFITAGMDVFCSPALRERFFLDTAPVGMR